MVEKVGSFSSTRWQDTGAKVVTMDPKTEIMTTESCSQVSLKQATTTTEAETKKRLQFPWCLSTQETGDLEGTRRGG